MSPSDQASGPQPSRWQTVLVAVRRKRTLVARVLVVLCVLHIILFGSQPLDLAEPSTWVIVAVGMILLGAVLRIAALGHLRKGERLATEGVYSLCRNPLYLGSILLIFGFCLLLNDLATIVCATAYLLIFYPLTINLEESHLVTQYGEAYRAYCRTTPRLLPYGRFRRGSFDWRQAARQGGALLVVLIGIGLTGIQVMTWFFPPP